jgi:hypothetical protein
MPKRSGRKSVSQTPAPKSDKIYGSKNNPKGSASSEKTAKSIKLSEQTEKVLKNKLSEFKEEHPNKKSVTLSDLKAVYRRGSGAYSKSHRPTITGGAPNSRAAWSYARVNKFLKKAGGEKVKAAYVQDDDLFAKGGQLGDCYKSAGDFCLLAPVEFIGEPYLVHAEVRGQGKAQGIRFGHAWVEDDENVYDYSNGREIVMTKVIYYAIGDIQTKNPKKYQKYTIPEARAKMLKTKNYGSWDIETDMEDGGEVTISNEDYNFFIGGDEYFGKAIKQNGVTIGGIEYDAEELKGIEIKTKFRKKGLAKKAVKALFEKKPSLKSVYVRAVPKAKPFWEKIGTKFDNYNEDAGLWEGNLKKYEYGGETSQEITCINCGWKWNTSDSDEEDMYLCHQCGFDNTLYYSDIMSKLKKPMSVSEISQKHGVNTQYIENQLDVGIKHELEHTDDEGVAKIIALHHIGEKPNYYELVEKYKLEDGGQHSKFWHQADQYEIADFIKNERMATEELLCSGDTRIAKAIICRAKIDIAEQKEQRAHNLEEKNAWSAVKNIWEECLKDIKNGVVYEYKDGGECGCMSYKDGGLAYGNSHDKGGMPLKVESTGQNIEIEGGEGVINKRSMQMSKKLDFQGKKMTPCQIVSKINEMGGGVKFKCQDVAEILAKDGNF